MEILLKTLARLLLSLSFYFKQLNLYMLVSLLPELIKMSNIKINKVVLVDLVVLVVLIVLIIELKICQIYQRLEKLKI